VLNLGAEIVAGGRVECGPVADYEGERLDGTARRLFHAAEPRHAEGCCRADRKQVALLVERDAVGRDQGRVGALLADLFIERADRSQRSRVARHGYVRRPKLDQRVRRVRVA